MKKLATFTIVLALATMLGAFSPAMADRPVGKVHDHEDAGPLTVESLCDSMLLVADTKIQKTVENFDGPCLIDLNGHDLIIQQVTLVIAGNLTIVDNGAGGEARIIASSITLSDGGSLDINISVSGDIIISRNVRIQVVNDVTISGHDISVRDNYITGNGNFTIGDGAPASEVSVKRNDFVGFSVVDISSDGDLFAFDNDFGGAAVTLASVGDCMAKGNTSPSESCS